MVLKINIAHKGKTFKVESENEGLVRYSIGEKIDGKEKNRDQMGARHKTPAGHDNARKHKNRSDRVFLPVVRNEINDTECGRHNTGRE